MPKVKTNDILSKVESVLDDVRPGIEMDGGGLDLISVKDGVVKIRIKGACIGCPMARFTFDEGVARLVREKVKGVKKVEFV